MRYLTLNEILELYRAIISQSGCKSGIHNLEALESALAQPQRTFDGNDLYPTLVDSQLLLYH